MKRYPHYLRALESRNYRLFIGGQCVSFLGSWMTSTASLWFAYHLSGSAFVVGLVGFANWIPLLLLAPLAGVVVDRVDGLRIVKVTQLLAMLQSAAMALITFSGHMTVPLLIGLCVVQGLVTAFDGPARQLLIVELAGDKALLDNVIALNSISINLTRIIGPALAGFVIAGAGPGVCYALDGLSFVAVLVALYAVQITPRPPRAAHRHPLTELREGLAYAWAHASIRRMLLLIPVLSVFGFSHSVLAPIFARDIFLGDARSLGFLMAASGFGSLIGGAFLTTRKMAFDFPRAVAWGTIIIGVGHLGLALSTGLPLGLLAYGTAGLGVTIALVSANTWLQREVEDDKRGRTMSLFSMGQGFFPLGSLALGAMTVGLGPRTAIGLGGSVLVVASLIFVRAFFYSTPIGPPGISSHEP